MTAQDSEGTRVVRYDRKGEVYTLLLDDATAKQKKRLMELCDLRLHEFIDKDLAIRRFRELDKRSSSGSLRYDVFAKSKGVCAACGVLSTEARLHIDHIIPISVGGRDRIDNMQALCYKCNTQKRDRDDTNFLLWHKNSSSGNADARCATAGSTPLKTAWRTVFLPGLIGLRRGSSETCHIIYESDIC